MTTQEISNLQLGDEVARDDGAIGFVLKNSSTAIELCWVSAWGARSVETLQPFKLISMARNLPPAATLPATSARSGGAV
jgi:hypothetical protein